MSQNVSEEVELLVTSEPLVAFLGTSRDDKPHVAPLWYRYEDETVEIMTTGRKLANIRANPKVSMAVEKDEAGIPEWMVTLQGTATVVEDETENTEANRKLNRKYGVDEDAWQENTLVRIDVETATSKTF